MTSQARGRVGADDAITSLETLADKLHDASDHERACATGAQFARMIAADLRAERDHYRSAYEGAVEALRILMGEHDDWQTKAERASFILAAALPDPKEDRG